METDLKPCPFCASHDLRELEVAVSDDLGDEQYTAIECRSCRANARASAWNYRGGLPWQQQLADQPAEDVDLDTRL